MSEFILMLGLFTAVGIFFMYQWIGPSLHGGASQQGIDKTTQRVAQDPS